MRSQDIIDRCEKENLRLKETNTDTFYYIFQYFNFMHDAIDGGLTYEQCMITKNITFPSGLKLIKGTKYDTVYFLFKEQEFMFINWKQITPTRSDSDPSRSITIPQSEMALFINWDHPPE